MNGIRIRLPLTENNTGIRIPLPIIKPKFNLDFLDKKQKKKYIFNDLDHYLEIEHKRIGNGTFGSVYLYESKKGIRMAVKEQFVKEDKIKNLENECLNLLNCKSKHAVKCYGVNYKDNILYIFMEYMETGPLRKLCTVNFAKKNESFNEVVKRKKYLIQKENVISYMARKILKGLRYLEKKKIWHRDIKPENILIDKQGYPKLIDFGVSKEVRDTLNQETLTGTYKYSSPERLIMKGINGNEFKIDIFSLGLILWEMAEGKFPIIYRYQGDFNYFWYNQDKFIKEKEEIVFPVSFSAEFKDFLISCLDKDVNERKEITELLKHDFITNTWRKKKEKRIRKRILKLFGQ